ncbi:MAG: TIGR04290 family methyltransferase [Hyphomicrobium sp.]|nr:TIGR04290 family methyltransferase [Hyphomicrobium sp.]
MTRVQGAPSGPEPHLQKKIEALGPWFHNINIGGVWTAPHHPLGDYPALKWQRFAPKVAGLVARRSVLDIGCNGGFYSIEMKRLGASRVVGIDSDPVYLDQARFAARMTGADIEFLQLSVYDVASMGERFDIVLFMGVVYHLRHPLLALDLISEHVAADRLIFQSMLRGSADVESVADDYPIKARTHFDRPGYPRLHFVEHRYAGDPTNWWVPNRTCCEAMLRSSGFAIEEQVEEEVFVCRRVRRPHGEGAVYPARSHP